MARSTVSLELPGPLKRKLELHARRSGISLSQLVIETLEPRLKRPRANGRRSLYEMSKDLCGSVRGGPRDLAANPKYLTGYGAWKR